MATKPAPKAAPKAAPAPIARTVYEADGAPRMTVNDKGLVVVVQKRIASPRFPGDVYGLRPEAAVLALREGEVELHAMSIVDAPDDDDAEEDTAPVAPIAPVSRPASPTPSDA